MNFLRQPFIVLAKYISLFVLYIEKIIKLEWTFFLKRTGFSQVVLGGVLLAQSVMLGLGDMSNFFSSIGVSEQSGFLENNPEVVQIISVSVIVILFFTLAMYERSKKAKEISQISDIIDKYALPGLEENLNDFKLQLCRDLNIAAQDATAYIFVPVRKSFSRWHFRPICCSKNISDRTKHCKRIKLRLHESMIGYQFLNRTGNYVDSWIFPVLNGEQAPKIYMPISQRNIASIGRNIKQVLITYSYYDGFIVGIFAMSINEDIDLSNEKDIADSCSRWIVDFEEPIKLIWRQKNNAWA